MGFFSRIFNVTDPIFHEKETRGAANVWQWGDVQESILGSKETNAQRAARLSAETIQNEQEAQLAKQEEELAAVSSRAAKAVADERRRRARRVGRSSTILTSFNQNLGNLNQSFRSTTGA